MSLDDDKSGASLMRAFDALEYLSGHAVHGAANKDLAAAMRCSPTNVTRTAAALMKKGWVERDEATGYFRITSRFSRLVHRVDAAFDRAQAQLDERKRNYTLSN
ncbi:MarR family transcriptional regulator [Variovorax sp.]|uniref:MarR family transcriptional regulator n=1 Tax=Variovorax sp. TaxID=1871043 RepID=UPI003BACF251